MNRHIFEVNAVQRLGEQIGYGNLMWLASALWRRKLVKDWGEGHEKGAFLPTVSVLLNEEGLDIFQQQIGIYDEIVADVLDDTEDSCMANNIGGGVYFTTSTDNLKKYKVDADRIAGAVERTKLYIKEN